MTDQTYLKAKSLWKTSFQFFHVVKIVCEKIVETKNPRSMVSDKKPSVEEFNELTKWSDYRAVVPILFNFYHALEILIKGFLIIDVTYKIKPKHSFEELVSSFVTNFPHEKGLAKILKKYTYQSLLPPMLKDFLKKNQLTINQLYEALRYPLDNKFIEVRSYADLQYKGGEGVQFYKELLSDIRVIQERIEQYYRINC